jgi:hypothetical protein
MYLAQTAKGDAVAGLHPMLTVVALSPPPRGVIFHVAWPSSVLEAPFVW